MDPSQLKTNIQFIYAIFVLLVNLVETIPSNRVVNPHPFKFKLNNPHLCDTNPDTLIWIHTAPTHHRLRTLVRNTWANPSRMKNRKTALVFFLGLSTEPTTQNLIKYESEMYHDIIQETYIDSYRNLTYKAISGCKWTSTYCKSAKLILKADDDMVVDIYLLFRHIDSLQSRNKVKSNTILCDVWYHRKPERDQGKWKISMDEYASKEYPPYCPGLGLVMTGDIIPKMYNESFYEPFFWVDDVYFTGLLGKTINVTFEQLASTVHFGPSKLIMTNTMFQNEYQWIFYHIQNNNLFHTLWSMIYSREQARLGRQSTKLPDDQLFSPDNHFNM